MTEKKILHVIDSLALGGAEKLLVNVVNNMKGFSHHVICLSKRADIESELNNDVKFIKLEFRTKRDIVRSVRYIRRYIRENNISVVHSHLVMGNILARLAAPRQVKVINSIHNLNGQKFFSKKFSWQRLAEKWTYKKHHHLIAVSAEVLADYKKFIGIKGPAEILHNFVDDKFFSNGPRKSDFTSHLKIIAVGSFKSQKNYNFLVEAFRLLPNNITIDIYGEGPLRSEIQRKISDYKLKNISLCGVDRQIEKKMRLYDLYVMSSIAEGHPIALLEAMACGMPVMVSHIPVLHEATNNFSIYFDINDTADFVKKITDIASGKIDLNKYAEYNFRYINKVGRKENYLKRLQELYSNTNAERI